MIEYEQSLIASLLKEPDLIQNIDFLSDQDFLTDKHKKIFLACNDLYAEKSGFDILSLSEKTGEFDYICDLTQKPPLASVNVVSRAIQSEGYKRRAIQQLDDSRQVVAKAATIDEAESAMSAVGDNLKSDTGESRSFNDMIKSGLDRLDSRIKGNVVDGLKTGFKAIDERLMGLQPQDFVVIAGRPSMGKTAYAMNIAENVTMAGGRALVFSLEMSEAQLLDRMFSSLSGIPFKSIRSGKFQDGDFSGLESAGYKLKKMDLNIIDKPALKLAHLCNIAHKFHRVKPLDLIVIDYLQLIRVPNVSRYDEISTISRGIKALAKHLNIPIIALSQLNRGVEGRPNKRPLMSDLRESGQIEQDADIIQMPYRDEYYNDQSDYKGFCEMITAKFRNGETGTDFLGTELDRMRFVEAQYVPQPKQETEYVYKK